METFLLILSRIKNFVCSWHNKREISSHFFNFQRHTGNYCGGVSIENKKEWYRRNYPSRKERFWTVTDQNRRWENIFKWVCNAKNFEMHIYRTQRTAFFCLDLRQKWTIKNSTIMSRGDLTVAKREKEARKLWGDMYHEQETGGWKIPPLMRQFVARYPEAGRIRYIVPVFGFFFHTDMIFVESEIDLWTYRTTKLLFPSGEKANSTVHGGFMCQVASQVMLSDT